MALATNNSVAKEMVVKDDTNISVLLFGTLFYHRSSFADVYISNPRFNISRYHGLDKYMFTKNIGFLQRIEVA
jgi:hypothetical protein